MLSLVFIYWWYSHHSPPHDHQHLSFTERRKLQPFRHYLHCDIHVISKFIKLRFSYAFGECKGSDSNCSQLNLIKTQITLANLLKVGLIVHQNLSFDHFETFCIKLTPSFTILTSFLSTHFCKNLDPIGSIFHCMLDPYQHHGEAPLILHLQPLLH